MGCVSSMFQFGTYIIREGGVDRKGSLPADYDEWKPRYYEPEVRKPDPPVVRPAPEPEIIPKPTPEVTELQRVHETKVEHEKITNDSGSTTEKTQYTQITESMRIQEGKGPIAEPFDSSKQHTVFPTFTELKTSVDTSPTADVKRHEIHILSPKASEPEVEDISESEKTEEEKEDAIVKIQAGVRGYLTRKALKERSVTPEPPPRPVSEDIVEKESSKAVQATSPTELKKGSSTVSPLAQPTTQASDEEQEEEESAEAEEAATKIQAAFRGYKVRKQGRPDPPARKNNQQIVVDLDEDEEEEEEEEEEDESDEGTVSESDE